jgi:hypothetical protein
VGGASSPSLTGFPACYTNSEFFFDGFLSCQQQAFRPVPQRVIFFVGLYPVSNRLSGLFHKELFFFGWIDITNITFSQKGGKCGMM